MVRRGRVVASRLGVCILVRVRMVAILSAVPAGCQCPSRACLDENHPFTDKQKTFAVGREKLR